jgi:4-hydroxybenzoate polyprenyltransferase
MTSRTSEETSVWYFVGATFILISPALFFRDLNSPWLTFGTIVAGLVLMALGFRVMAREREAARAARGAGATAAAAAGAAPPLALPEESDADGHPRDEPRPRS